MKKKTVLHVDDNQSQRELTRLLIERIDSQIEVVEAANGHFALEALRSGAIDAVITDYDMPGMDGLELLKALQQMPDAPPVVMLTGSSDNSCAETAIGLGAKAYYQKRVGGKNFRELVQQIRTLIRERDIR